VAGAVSWRDAGPEWNPLLLVLAVLAALAMLATLEWWLGVAGLMAALIALGLYGMVRP